MSRQRTGSGGIFRRSLCATSIVHRCLCGLLAASAIAAVAAYSLAAAARTARRPGSALGLLLRAVAVAALVLGLGVVWAPAAGAVPPIPVKVSPKGTSNSPTPDYVWNAAAGAVRYHLMVRNVHGTAVNLGYTAAAANCAGGGRCSVKPTNMLAKGVTYWWTVTAADATGWSPYGPWFEFKPGGVPPWVRLIAPSGTINTPMVNYIWEAVPGEVTVYEVVVQFEPNTPRDRIIVKRELTPAQVGCAGGGRCVFLGPTGGPGAHVWYVRAGNAVGWGQWRSLGFTRS